MPAVFVIAEDWTLRMGIRAELRERGIHALGMESAVDVGSALAAGEKPSVIILDATAKAANDPAVRQLAGRVPTILIASQVLTAQPISAAKILVRPVRIAEVVAVVLQLLGTKRV